jgi:hypothetical protein
MIKNFKIFKNPSVKTKLCAISLAGLLAIVSLTGCSSNDYRDPNAALYEQRQVYKAGQHIISIPIDDPIQNNVQYPYHPGYKPVGLATTAYGRYSYSFGGACIMYMNTEEVKCISTGLNDNNFPIYGGFGVPTVEEPKKDNSATSEIKDFDIGEHILSIPFDIDSTDSNIQYPYYEGYEPIDIASSAYGQYSDAFGGTCILYINVVPVRCRIDGNNTYTNLGTPIELEKTKTLN